MGLDSGDEHLEMMVSQMYTGSGAAGGVSSAAFAGGKKEQPCIRLTERLVLIKTHKRMHEKYALNNEITQVQPLISGFSWEKKSLEYRNYTDLLISNKSTVIPH